MPQDASYLYKNHGEAVLLLPSGLQKPLQEAVNPPVHGSLLS